MKVSVITATYNCVEYIEHCLESVASQSYSNVEHVVIDGASTDGTLEVLVKLQEQLSILVSEPDAGIYDALNKGISRSTGDVIGFLHADDMYAHSEVLTNIIDVFASDTEVCAVYGDLQYVSLNSEEKVVRYWRSAPYSPCRLKWGWMPPHPTLYVRRQWYERIGGFDTRYSISADYFSILQLFAQSDFRTIYLPEVLVAMRLGGASNRSLEAVYRKTREDWHALRRSGVGISASVVALTWKNLSKLRQFWVGGS